MKWIFTRLISTTIDSLVVTLPSTLPDSHTTPCTVGLYINRSFGVPGVSLWIFLDGYSTYYYDFGAERWEQTSSAFWNVSLFPQWSKLGPLQQIRITVPSHSTSSRDELSAGSGSTNLCSRAINTHHVRRIDVRSADLARSVCKTRIYLVRVAGNQKGARYRMLKTWEQPSVWC